MIAYGSVNTAFEKKQLFFSSLHYFFLIACSTLISTFICKKLNFIQKQVFSTFFQKNQALLSALLFLLGAALSFCFDFVLFGLLLALLSLSTKRSFFFLVWIPIFAFLYSSYFQEHFPIKENSVYGKATVELIEIKEHKTHFKKRFFFKGKLHLPEKNIKNIPCSFPIQADMRPLKARVYCIYGTLEKLEHGFIFKPDPLLPWEGIKNGFCLAEHRFQSKNFLKQKMHSLYTQPPVLEFLTALTLGDLNDPLLRFSFGRLGLQHILAISGFHFGMLALFIGSALRFLFSQRIATLGLMFFLTAYFFLLSSSPSITRAFLAIMLYLLGKLLKRQTKPLNLFGAVLLIELLLDPKNCTNLGFQLSFLATGAILLGYPVTFSWMEKSPERSACMSVRSAWGS